MLTKEGKVYLPPKQDATQSFLREIMMSKKKYVSWKNVKVIKVPQYKGIMLEIFFTLLIEIFTLKDFCISMTTSKIQIESGSVKL